MECCKTGFTNKYNFVHIIICFAINRLNLNVINTI